MSALDEFHGMITTLEQLIEYEDQLGELKCRLNFSIFYNKFLLNWRLGSIPHFLPLFHIFYYCFIIIMIL